jgi:lipase ATG15
MKRPVLVHQIKLDESATVPTALELRSPLCCGHVRNEQCSNSGCVLCNVEMLLVTLTAWLTPLLSLLSNDATHHAPRDQLQLELRHQHAVSKSGKIIFADIARAQANSIDGFHNMYSLKTRKIASYKPLAAPPRSPRLGLKEGTGWEGVEVIGPDVESRETLLELAKMTHNAYLEVNDTRWYNLGGNWTSVSELFPWRSSASVIDIVDNDV